MTTAANPSDSASIDDNFPAQDCRRSARNSLYREFPGRWAFWWILLPNCFAIVMMAIGGPSNAFVVLACGTAALVVSCTSSLLVRRLGIVLICFASTAMYVALLFNIDPQKALVSLPYLYELDPLESPEYVISGGAFVCACVIAAWFGARRRGPASFSGRLAALGGLALLVNLMVLGHSDARGTYRTNPPPGTPIDSAVLQNGVTPAIEDGRNLVLIIVESLGVPENPHDKALFERIWGRERWSDRYDVKFGTTSYYGSTTNAEFRELCGVWSDYTRADFKKLDCLPNRFLKAGYETISIHAFNSTTFDRAEWYPKIGIQKQFYAPELWKRGAEFCRGVFPGACDRNVPRIIGDHLRRAAHKSQFVYWLTLNSHLPVPSNRSLHTDNCLEGGRQWSVDFPMLCREYRLNRELADALADEIMRPDFPPTDFLIVGDHMPPYFQRYLRKRFDPAHVPWIMLKHRSVQRVVRR